MIYTAGRNRPLAQLKLFRPLQWYSRLLNTPPRDAYPSWDRTISVWGQPVKAAIGTRVRDGSGAWWWSLKGSSEAQRVFLIPGQTRIHYDSRVTLICIMNYRHYALVYASSHSNLSDYRRGSGVFCHSHHITIAARVSISQKWDPILHPLSCAQICEMYSRLIPTLARFMLFVWVRDSVLSRVVPRKQTCLHQCLWLADYANKSKVERDAGK